ncbi:MOSC domain-containing protein [Psychromonas sp. MME2]|uniref:MOSC domain-containing protein n=1 Tax=Psychromonas sp. MME2 TaxID=3231033 RepID=UPI00339C7AA7
MQRAQIWSDHVQAQHCNVRYDQWFSEYLQQPCQLLFFSEQTRRLVKNRETSVSFADGYPLLLVNQASVEQLNARLQKPVTALHFRPNIVVKGDFPFVEDSWARIKIGEVEFEVSKPCSRCPFTNVDPKTGHSADNEPLATLSTFRYHQGDIDFGQNLIPLNSGMIRAGDEVKVLATQAAPFYSSLKDNAVNNKKELNIHFQGSDFVAHGDNQQLLLESGRAGGN